MITRCNSKLKMLKIRVRHRGHHEKKPTLLQELNNHAVEKYESLIFQQ